jgi:hypothetical protein
MPRNYDGGGMEGEMVAPSIFTGRRAASSPVNGYEESVTVHHGDSTRYAFVRERIPLLCHLHGISVPFPGPNSYHRVNR